MRSATGKCRGADATAPHRPRPAGENGPAAAAWETPDCSWLCDAGRLPLLSDSVCLKSSQPGVPDLLRVYLLLASSADFILSLACCCICFSMPLALLRASRCVLMMSG